MSLTSNVVLLSTALVLKNFLWQRNCLASAARLNAINGPKIPADLVVIKLFTTILDLFLPQSISRPIFFRQHYEFVVDMNTATSGWSQRIDCEISFLFAPVESTYWRPPVSLLLGLYRIFNYGIHVNTWMVTHSRASCGSRCLTSVIV